MNPDSDAYLDTIKRLEPDIAMIDYVVGIASIAISLKRIADALDGLDGIEELSTDLGRIREVLEYAFGERETPEGHSAASRLLSALYGLAES